jgi:hypothetical protein
MVALLREYYVERQDQTVSVARSSVADVDGHILASQIAERADIPFRTLLMAQGHVPGEVLDDPEVHVLLVEVLVSSLDGPLLMGLPHGFSAPGVFLIVQMEVVVPVRHDGQPIGAQDPEDLGIGLLGMLETPEDVTGDHQIEG